MTNAELRTQIQRLQEIQKTHHPRTSAWVQASAMLAECYAEAARRKLPAIDPLISNFNRRKHQCAN